MKTNKIRCWDCDNLIKLKDKITIHSDGYISHKQCKQESGLNYYIINYNTLSKLYDKPFRTQWEAHKKGLELQSQYYKSGEKMGYPLWFVRGIIGKL